MKKTILFVLVSLFTIQLATARDVVTKDVEKLPQQAKAFIAKFYPEEKVSYIKIDEEIIETTYDVVFVSGVELEFNKDGVWKEIDGKYMAIPAGIIPQKISDYVQRTFPESSVNKVEKKKYRYEVELSNRLDLEFDKDGNFIRIDD